MGTFEGIGAAVMAFGMSAVIIGILAAGGWALYQAAKCMSKEGLGCFKVCR